MANTAEVLSTGQVLLTEVAAQVIEITTPSAPAVVEVVTEGPIGPPYITYLAQLDDVNTSERVGGSVLVYDEETSQWVGNDVNTVVTLTDGGNF